MVHGNVLSHLGTKYMLPVGTERTSYEEYEEVVIPPAKAVPPRMNERLIPITELDALGKGSYPVRSKSTVTCHQLKGSFIAGLYNSQPDTVHRISDRLWI